MGLPVEVNNLMLGSLGGYTVGRSLRFRSSANGYLNRTPTVAGNRKTWTWSAWVKFGNLSFSFAPLFSAGPAATNARLAINIESDNTLSLNMYGAAALARTTQVFRDPSAWYHIIVALDTTQATAANRCKIYVNGVQVTSFSTSPNFTLNADYPINDAVLHTISKFSSDPYWFDGYMAEVNFIDGQQLAPSSFGAYDTNGVWQPKKYSGTYGTNGFYLNFSDNSAATAAAIGKDSSGNGNNWTPNNIDMTSNNYRSFTTVGTYGWTAPAGVTSVNYLVVGGGGGGGGSSPNYVSGGGGGGGGVLSGTLSVTPGTTYTVTVGAGGAAGAGSLGGNGGNGGNSIFATITAIGGGGGGAYTAGPSTGGSGGGGANNGAGQAGAAGTSGQGNAGGNAGTYFNSTSSQGGGGGGGAGAAGSNFNGLNGGAGGAGIASTITGSTVYYGGGGGGGAANGTGGAAGSGGGGAGGSGNSSGGASGAANTGGGGGGASTQLSGSPTGGAGGSGVVILAYSGALQAGTTYDSMVDSPTNAAGTSTGIGNYAVLNAIDKSSSFTLTNGNLSSSVATTWQNARATFGITSGKWYWEYTMTATGLTMLGVGTSSVPLTGGAYLNAGFYGYYSFDGSKWNNNTNTSYGNTFTTNDIVGVAFDADSGKIWFSKNGTWQASGDPVAGTNAAYSSLTAIPYFPTVSLDNSQGANGGAINFGQRPFSYTPPSGFKALNTYNLPAPSIANGAQYMAASLYTGNGGTAQTITNTVNSTSFQPDFVWIKSRNSASFSHRLYDSVRGVGKELYSNATNAESTVAQSLTAFASNGFTLGTDTNNNASGTTYVGWQWKGGGTAVTNNSGTISSQVSANTSAGFSIVSYTGTGALATVGHGLGVAPDLIIWKNRSSVQNWVTYHRSLGASGNVYLNLTAGYSADSTTHNNTAPTSSVFTVATSGAVNGSTNNIVAYCFSAVRGFSAFGSYTGNGSADGPFIYTGFRPRWIMWKATSTTGQWFIHDTARSTYNYSDLELVAETSAAEYSASGAGAGQRMDILSNGFKARTTNNANNQSGATYIYMAFAENPFNSSRAR